MVSAHFYVLSSRARLFNFSSLLGRGHVRPSANHFSFGAAGAQQNLRQNIGGRGGGGGAESSAVQPSSGVENRSVAGPRNPHALALGSPPLQQGIDKGGRTPKKEK